MGPCGWLVLGSLGFELWGDPGQVHCAGDGSGAVRCLPGPSPPAAPSPQIVIPTLLLLLRRPSQKDAFHAAGRPGSVRLGFTGRDKLEDTLTHFTPSPGI